MTAIIAEIPPIFETAFFWVLAPIGAVLALAFAFGFYRTVMAASEGEPEMIRIAKAVREGAYAYLTRQWAVIFWVFIALVVVLLLLAFVLKLQPQLTALGVPIAGFFSGLCGYFGMRTATNASARTTAAAKESLNSGLRVAFRAGAVMGLCVTGFALLDISIWFFLLSQVFNIGSLTDITTITLSFAMGASLQALFARVGGGIYTKAADVGADLVGKVEAGIPEDDARNPATIADNVGDNVGDVAGMGADLYESYYGSILAAMALAAAAAIQLSLDASSSLKLVCIPPALAGLGIMTSIFSIFFVRTKEGANLGALLKSLHAGVWLSSILIIAGSLGILFWGLGDVESVSVWGLWISIIVGLLAGLVIAQGTEYYTSYDHAPTQRISEQAQTGPATVIIAGIAEGMKSTWIPLITVVVAILVAFVAAGGADTFLMGVFGVGIAAVGMLSTLGITLATDAYGPIADNAGGNAEMTHQEPYVRERTDMLDSLGNTTAATGKGFAIGSAALTALALLAAYVITVQTNLARIVDASATTAVEAKYDYNASYQGEGLFVVYERGSDPAEPNRIPAMVISQRDREILDGHRDEVSGMTEAIWDEGLGMWMVSMNFEGNKTHKFEIVSIKESKLPQLLAYYNVNLMNPKVLGGLFIGVMLVFVFCAMTMNAVGRAAFSMMQECRRQFGIMKKGFKDQGLSEEDISDPLKWPYQVTVDGEEYPDYANCVAISTYGAQKEMIKPSIMALVVPILAGLILGVPGTMGLLAGTLVCGFAVAIFMANSGGAWDNAKKYIETGQFGGKGSDSHKAGVVGDTVGDPFKDTSGPSLNILIKLVSIVSVVFAGLIVKFSPFISQVLQLGN
ncbi:MAG: sodium-translocating pyrophosphatase [Phycisphaerae bacterium]|nr:sodium-translocating pyrophosphatase [Phycisphaerae bacterium]